MHTEAFDLLATSIFLLDAQGHIVYANAAAENLFSRSRKQMEGQAAARLFEHPAPVQAVIARAMADATTDVRQSASVPRTMAAALEVSLSTLGLTGQRWSVLLEIREIEQRMLADRNHRLTEAIAAHRELLRNLAHEVKNPLGGLRGAAQLLEAELPHAGLTEYTQVIISEADRLQALVDRLSGPQRQAFKPQTVNIHEICERVCALTQAEFRGSVTLLRDYDASVPEMTGDPALLMQAVLNVTRNAAQAVQTDTLDTARAAGTITLRTRITHQVIIGDRQYRSALVLSVIDNGPGVPDSIRERLFHPLVTARVGGTGLGLSLAQDFVQQHGGLIDCESQSGHTEFRLIFPMEFTFG